MIPIAPHEQAPSNAPTEQIGHNALELDHSQRESEVQNLEKRDYQGTIAKRPSAAVAECAHDGDQVSKRARYVVWSTGECQCRGTVHSVNTHQFRRDTARKGRLGRPPFPLVQQRNPRRALQRSVQTGLVPSNLSWGLSPPSTPATEFACDLHSQPSIYSHLFAGNCHRKKQDRRPTLTCDHVGTTFCNASR